ncbi:recombinase family protein [Blautia sp.]|jgi:site-specific DNA recombinase|uniref:recombinase family protein n=1 Tax=Blautia sp. TaxID=1955243 RepID=UPI00257A5589|nr:recombinase family protein [Blautia sp.]
MARVSRKNIAVTAVSATEEMKLYKACLYLRLSDEDKRNIEDNSIGNQKKICLEHLKKLPEIEVIASYIDNGASGTNFSRSGFKQMLQDLTKGEINCVVVKDLSRLGRNYLETSEYLEKFFPEAGIRFIAVNNGYDSIRKLNGKQEIVIPFSNIVNDMYAKDVSRKIRSSIETLMKSGEFLPPSGSIPYGYLRDEKNNTYIIDEETAPIVQEIFKMKLQGVSDCEIIRTLNRKQIPSPGKIRYLRGMTKAEKYKDAVWIGSTLRKLLSNEVYLGHRIHGKVKRDCLGAEKKRRPQDEWEYVYNVHPALISEEDFQKIRQIKEKGREKQAQCNKHQKRSLEERRLLTGKIYCGDCGTLMGARKGNQRLTSKKSPRIFYQCDGYEYSGRTRCFNHYISQKDVLEKIKNALNVQFKLIAESDRVIKSIQDDKKGMLALHDKKRKEINDELAKMKMKKERLLIDYNDGTINSEEYKYIRQKYDDEEQKLRRVLVFAEKERKNQEKQLRITEEWVKLMKQFMPQKNIDRKLIEHLIDTIYVYGNKNVEIVFLFKNEVEELTGAAREAERKERNIG